MSDIHSIAPTETSVKSLHAMALAAYQKQVALSKEYQHKRDEEERQKALSYALKACEEFTRKFGIAPDNWQLSDNDRFYVYLSFGDVQVGCSTASGYFRYYLRGVCPKCGEPVSSDPIGNLIELGALLTDFHPYLGHTEYCEPPAALRPVTPQPALPEPPKSIEERIARALERIADHMEYAP